MYKFIVVCMVFLAAFSTVAAAPAKNNAKKPQSQIVTQGKPIPSELREGAFSVKLGDTIEKSLKFFGQPRVILANGESYTWRSRINLNSPELVIKLKPSKVIWTIVADHLPMIKTPEGIGFGSTKEEIEAVYGKSKGYVTPGGDIIVSYGGDPIHSPFMRFRLTGDKVKRVTYMIIGHYDVDKKGKGGKKGKRKR